jgi:hypothetical protein
MTNIARDERDIAPYDWTLNSGPEGPALVSETSPLDAASNQVVTYYTREPDNFVPDDIRWQPLTDPAEIATIEAALARGIDLPYEVWTDQAPSALTPGDLTPLGEAATASYAWEQTGPAVGDGQFYEVTDPVVTTAYAEAQPAPYGVEIINPVDYYDAAWVADAATLDPAVYDARIDALAATGAPWLEVESVGDGFALGRYAAGPIERDTNGWEPVRVADGPDDGPLGNAYPDEATARQAAIAYNGADLDLAPVAALDRDLTPALDL